MLLLLHSSVWPPLIVVIVILGVLSIFVSHKIAGPVYRLKRSLEQITAGDLALRVHLRKGDDLQDLADQLNLLTAEMQQFVSTLADESSALAGQIDALEEWVDAESPAAAEGRVMVARLKETRAEIAATLQKFVPGEVATHQPEDSPE